jgi:hypothetical protein
MIPSWIKQDRYGSLGAIGLLVGAVRLIISESVIATVLEWVSVICLSWASIHYYLSRYLTEVRDPKDPKPPE